MKLYCKLLFSGLTFFGALISCSRTQSFRQEEGMAWNTIYHITYESGESLSDSIMKILNEIDYSLSPFNPVSTLSAINSNACRKTDNHFRAVFEESVKINRLSSGAFDPTLAPLIRAWGFGQGHTVSPDTMKIDSLLNMVGLGKTNISNGELIKDNPHIEFNFSALAKGYGVDCIAEMFLRNNVENFLVEIGGEIRASGKSPRGEDWIIGIDRPEAGARYGETVMNIRVSDAAIATSGNYRNYQESGGRRFGHTISSLTGRPVATDIISATVITSDCMEADALATTCMAIGSGRALEMCSVLEAGVMLILDDMRVVMNKDFQKYLKE